MSSNPISRRMRANSIRALAMDCVQKANSGHPGMPMGMADIAQVLWQDFLKHDPKNPDWINRDRFILSNGHGSMLQYALLHLTGYDLSIDDLKNFRQLHSKTPGHPEYGLTPGVETTTGPLGQGIAQGVGMALAEKMLALEFNRENFAVIHHYTYVFLGDGCLMEGISHEACSLAGTWQLGKLIAFWDDNGISIDGQTKDWFTDNTPERFRAYGWQVIESINGHDPESIKQAIIFAQSEQNKPTLICCKTVIGFGSPHKSGSADAHGAPLGEEEITLTKAKLGWPYAAFEIPDNIYAAWNALDQGKKLSTAWEVLFQAYQIQYPALAKEFLRRKKNILPPDFQEKMLNQLNLFAQKTEAIATRKASQLCIDFFSEVCLELAGGSADLTHSNLTFSKQAKQYIYYGVREFGMSAIMCGIAVYKGYIPFGGTFLTFCDYARNAVRLAALMKIRVIFIYTHDSIGLGEDGPTHQPIEHITMLRATPDLFVWRPCDLIETFIAWQMSIESIHHPSCLLLSRQNLPQQTHDNINTIKSGGYNLYGTDPDKNTENKNPDIILIATGSEVNLAMQAAVILENQHQKSIRVVSMPCVELFLSQSLDYQESILPAAIKNRIAIEAGATLSWHRFTGLEGKIIGIDHFGESAPAEKIYKLANITVENIVNTALSF